MAPARPHVLLMAALASSPASAADLSDVVSYDEGLQIESRDDAFGLRVMWRIQYRLSGPFDSNPKSVADLDAEPGAVDFSVRRARFAVGGHLGWHWLRYFTEVELTKPTLLDARAMIGPKDKFELWVGQYKAGYGRERQGSSREQQFVDRSLSNGFFTIDRQVGFEIRAQSPGWAKVGASLGVYAGNGPLEIGTDPYPMLMARLQWHPQGVLEEASMSDLAFSEEPVSTFTIGGAWTRGPYTAFSSAGGGQLAGFEAGGDDRYGLVQGLLDASLRWRGLSVQGEANLKDVLDTELDDHTLLHGGYAQIGWLPHGVFPAFPAPYEIAFRTSWVDPGVGVSGDAMTELTLAANAYIHGHRVKVTADGTRFAGHGAESWRGRLQFDFSF